MESSFTAGVIAAGYTPVLCGVISTPGLAKILSNHRYAGGAMISASHNPYFDNGFKFFGSSGQKIPERKINQIEEKINSVESPPMMTKKLQDKVKFINGASSYLNSINQKKKYTSNKIILDCANGSLSHIANKFFEPHIRNLVLYGTRPDGFNINHLCGSTNISFLQEEVLKNQADIGFAFDGDGDGVPDVDDLFPNDPDESKDSDGDGVGDNADLAPSIANDLIYSAGAIMAIGLLAMLVLVSRNSRGKDNAVAWNSDHAVA